MAPRGRGRARKVGLGRMDAALDAMRPLGFSDALVRKTLKDLLKVYGGDEGWPFIEEASYKVLIDTILEGQEQCEPEICLLKNEASQEELGIQVQSSDIHCVQVHSQHTHSLRPVDDIPYFVKDDTSQEMLGVQVHSSHVNSPCSCSPPPLDIFPYLMKDEASQDNLGVQVHTPSIHSTAPALCLPNRRRKPCFGWISSDDEEDFVILTPAT